MPGQRLYPIHCATATPTRPNRSHPQAHGPTAQRAQASEANPLELYAHGCMRMEVASAHKVGLILGRSPSQRRRPGGISLDPQPRLCQCFVLGSALASKSSPRTAADLGRSASVSET
jgi:hypothetical protein